MKLIPDSLGRRIGEQSLFASEKAPKILFVGGVIGMVGSTILACRATLKLEEVLDEIESNKDLAKQIKERVDDGVTVEPGTTYTDSEHHRDLTIITVRGAGSIAKLYAPSVLLGAASIAALTKSHSILQDRNLAITAAYAAVDAAFTRYRERVVDKFGEEVDSDIYYESEQVDIVDEETGKVTPTTVVTGAPGSPYKRFYDEQSSRNWSPDPRNNILFLRSVQNHLNDHLRAHGHVFLNEVFSALGMSHTKAGAVVGWRWDKNSGDDYIDFGVWDGTDEAATAFFNGREGAILLDFNVDGVIYNKIEETGR
jgi:hypothetical protein